MTMHKALHPRDDVDRLYVSRREGGRGLASIEDSVDASIHDDHLMSARRPDLIIKNNNKKIEVAKLSTLLSRLTTE